jgi:hypothetical protein
MAEQWKDVPGFGGHYQASSLGRVRSKARAVSKNHKCGRAIVQHYGERVLSPVDDGGGYLVVCLGVDGKQQSARVHTMVCAAWNGERPKGLFCCHSDGDSHNNRPENLRWDTPAANSADSLTHGTRVRGQKHSQAKFSPQLVARIVLGQIAYREASTLGVSKAHFYRLRKRCPVWFQETYGGEARSVALGILPPMAEAA